MSATTEEAKAQRIEEVIARVHERLPAAEAREAETFVRQYYRQVAPEDVLERNRDDLYGAALSHLHFARKFLSGTPKLRVCNPNLEEHGWQCSHTVIEIVNDDMPFLVDSITMEVNRQGLTLHLIIHPVMNLVRDAAGNLLEVPSGEGGIHESLMHVEVDRRTDPQALEALGAGLTHILGHVRAAVTDWKAMGAAARAAVAEVAAAPAALPADEVSEAAAFLEWVAEDHFTFLGCRDYDLIDTPDGPQLRVVPGSGLGILRDEGGARMSQSFAQLPREARELASRPGLLVLSKGNARATVHRPGYVDYIGVKRFDAQGRVTGERRFVGLYTSTAYHANPADIPLLRRKVAYVMELSGVMPGSHMGKALVTILENYPRDELFQISRAELFTTAIGILRLGERQRTRLFVRRDDFGRFLSCLIYVPRDKYNTELRGRMQRVLMEAFDGVSSEFTVQLSESALARILMTVHTPSGRIPDYDVRDIERKLAQAARRWEDELNDLLITHTGEERGNRLAELYAAAFPAGYREGYQARAAVHDIELAESLSPEEDLRLSLYLPLEAPPGSLRMKIFRLGQPVPLSRSLPMLEHMGVKVLEERPFEIRRSGAQAVWLHDVGMSYGAAEVEIEPIRGIFQEAFSRAWRGEIENDDFNRLVLAARLDWREVALLRAYAKYLRQAAFTFSQAYMEATLSNHADIAAKLVALFHARFDPAGDAGRGERVTAIAAEIESALDDVANLDEDRILRQFLAVMLATIRTNFYQTKDGKPKPYLSFKFDPKAVPGLPEPRPMFEISVYSPRIEGVHLRGGKVARGGLRWSDRMEDFRTEVLGLVKAQMVKNAVIVPVGSKGGFVVKQPPPASDREAYMREGIACYQTFLRGLLDLTDNLVMGKVVPPRDVTRHDPDDPYLVVAADKGTATFSDIANGISAEYGFWLGDAFASGGSVGYDHKKMAITARGAWESAKRHFRELGKNIQEEDFTVIGIGDMSGDVFGNGMLLSRHIRLLAAFDHRHVFLDPNPDTEASFTERERLFALPRSSWADYDARLISAGGGIHPRSAKSITLTPEVRALLVGVDAATMTPAELIHALLQAPVDLLYNGGIGTYVKAASQSNADVGDRANDAIRVNGAQLRCKVLVEGGNLGCTQLGRVEFALAGGKLYTDAIDNSAGVDCSDHEVNIKILLNAVIAEGELTEKQRNKLLVDMTEDVAALVLRDNYFQTQSISVSRSRGTANLDAQMRFIRRLEKSGRLNRVIEFLPADDEIAERSQAGQGLTTPELAVLLAYSKMELYDSVLASTVPEDPFISTALMRYFPPLLKEKFPEHISRHALRREIISTHVINSMINRVGNSFAHRLQEESGAPQPDVVRAYIATREIFGLVDLWKEIEALDNRVPAATQIAMVSDSDKLIQRGTLWFLRNRQHTADIAQALAHFGPGVRAVSAGLDAMLMAPDRAALDAAAAQYASHGVPDVLARRVAGLEPLYSALDIVEVGVATGRPVELVAAVYFALGGRLNLHWLSQQIALLPEDSHWQAMSRAALRDDLSGQARALTADVLRASPVHGERNALMTAWEHKRQLAISRYQQLTGELQPIGQLDLSMLSVALRELRAVG